MVVVMVLVEVVESPAVELNKADAVQEAGWWGGAAEGKGGWGTLGSSPTRASSGAGQADRTGWGRGLVGGGRDRLALLLLSGLLGKSNSVHRSLRPPRSSRA